MVQCMIAFDEPIVMGEYSGLNGSRKTGLFLKDKVRITSPVSGTVLVKLVVLAFTQSHGRVVLPDEKKKDTVGEPALYLIPRFHGYFIIENLGHPRLYSRSTTELETTATWRFTRR